MAPWSLQDPASPPGPTFSLLPCTQPQQIHKPRPSRRLCSNRLPTWRPLSAYASPRPLHTHTRPPRKAALPVPVKPSLPSLPHIPWAWLSLVAGGHEGGTSLGACHSAPGLGAAESALLPELGPASQQVAALAGEEGLARSHLHLTEGEDSRPNKASAAAAPGARTAAKAPLLSACRGGGQPGSCCPLLLAAAAVCQATGPGRQRGAARPQQWESR